MQKVVMTGLAFILIAMVALIAISIPPADALVNQNMMFTSDAGASGSFDYVSTATSVNCGEKQETDCPGILETQAYSAHLMSRGKTAITGSFTGSPGTVSTGTDISASKKLMYSESLYTMQVTAPVNKGSCIGPGAGCGTGNGSATYQTAYIGSSYVLDNGGKIQTSGAMKSGATYQIDASGIGMGSTFMSGKTMAGTLTSGKPTVSLDQYVDSRYKVTGNFTMTGTMGITF